MQSSFCTVMVHAGLYVSGDGRYKIRRTQKVGHGRHGSVKLWVWVVSRMGDGEWQPVHTFRTLKVAREWVGDQTDLEMLF